MDMLTDGQTVPQHTLQYTPFTYVDGIYIRQVSRGVVLPTIN